MSDLPALYSHGLRVQRHPSRMFIRYLLTLGDGEKFGPSFVNRGLTDLGLFPADEESIIEEAEELRDMANRPVPFLPSAVKRDSKTKLYLKSAGVLSMHLSHKGVRDATAILGSALLRDDVETGLLGHVPHQELVKVLNERYDTENLVSEDALEEYSRYYFNPNAMTLPEWAYWLREMEDTRRLPILQGGPMVALHRLGQSARLEGSKMLRRIEQSIFFRFLEVDQMPTNPVSVKMLTGLSSEFRSVWGTLKDAGEDLDDVMDRFGKFAMRNTDEDQVVSIDDIAPPGSHSGEVG